MRMTLLGHSTFFVELDGRRILTDPWLTEPLYWGRLRHADPFCAPHEVLPLDLIVISHGHQDHCDLNTLAAFPKSIPVVIYAKHAARVRKCGFKNILPVEAGDHVEPCGIRVSALPGRHLGGTVTYMISGETQKFFFAGDSLFPEALKAALRKTSPDVAVVPVSGGGLGPFKFHMSIKDAAQLVTEATPKFVVPSHYQFQLQLTPKWMAGMLQRPDGLSEFRQALLDEGGAAELKILRVSEAWDV